MPAAEALDIRIRKLVQQLTEDLGWLEEHARQHPERAPLAGRLRLAAALVRNQIGPFAEGATDGPMHVAVVGGAGAGKSTITNFLIGAAAAEANPQAGFTRHPIAYVPPGGPTAWSQHVGFLGPLQRLFDAKPSNLDQDVYQVRQVQPADNGQSLLHRLVVWDCPDMTTWAATSYTSRLVEVIGLADLVIYVASDERYNDEVPTQFLQLVLQAGRPVITCIVKMPEQHAQAIVDHFRKEVVARMPECTRVAACLAVPHLTAHQLADPVRRAAAYRQPLIDQVKWWADRPTESRKTAVRGALEFLSKSQESLLAVARRDIEALKDWKGLVEKGRVEFEHRYEREYLRGEKFPRFNEALVRLLQLLELPGVGQYVSKTLWAVRAPYRWVKGVIGKMSHAPPPSAMPEEPVLTAALTGWLDGLRREATHRAGPDRDDAHALWQHVQRGFQTGLPSQVQQEFQKRLKEFQFGLVKDVEATAQAIYQDLENKPVALNSLRGVKFTAELGSIGLSVASFGLNAWDAVLPFVIAPVIQELVEFFGKHYVDQQRELARERQRVLFSRLLAAPLNAWLTEWPATGGSSFERLQRALQRVPEDVAALTALVKPRLA